MGQAGGRRPGGPGARAPAGSGAFADTHGEHARGQGQHVAAFQVFQARGRRGCGAGESRVIAVDGRGERGLAVPRRHRQRRTATRSPTQTEESRVNSRLGSGSMTKSRAVHHRVDQARPARSSSWARPAISVVGEASGSCPARWLARPAAACRRGGGRRGRPRSARRGRPGRPASRPGVGQMKHLDAAVAQRLGEDVVLLLRAADPRDAVEEQGSLLRGVRRASSAPGRCSITVRSRLTSLVAPIRSTENVVDHAQRLDTRSAHGRRATCVGDRRLAERRSAAVLASPRRARSGRR